VPATTIGIKTDKPVNNPIKVSNGVFPSSKASNIEFIAPKAAVT
jgi:hypothetical protein